MSVVVGIFNSSEEVVDLVKDALEREGFLVVMGHVMGIRRGAINLEAFIKQHRPKVIVYDLIPPYEKSWEFLEHVRHSDFMDGVQFVLTSLNSTRVREIVAPNEHVYEIVGKSSDLTDIVRAVKEASRSRPTR